MKRIISLILISAICFSLTACGGSNDRTSNNTAVNNTSQNQTSYSGSAAAGSGKILIAYFAEAENSEVDVVASPSVVTVNGKTVGRMRALADMIQSRTGGDLFCIQTSVQYPGDIGDLIDYAAEEQDKNARPELTAHIENFDDYDTVFVGYPNWWYDMPMVMYSFFDEYDFSGKTIIPFNSHNGSRFSDTIQTISELEPNATVIKDGFTVNERDVADSADDIADWLSGLGY